MAESLDKFISNSAQTVANWKKTTMATTTS